MLILLFLVVLKIALKSKISLVMTNVIACSTLIITSLVYLCVQNILTFASETSNENGIMAFVPLTCVLI